MSRSLVVLMHQLDTTGQRVRLGVGIVVGCCLGSGLSWPVGNGDDVVVGGDIDTAMCTEDRQRRWR